MNVGEDGEWLWEPERVMPGEIVLGPTYRLMMLHTATDETRVFVDCANGSRLCKHGELGSSIGTWVHLEQTARREGRPPPPRPSICDCESAAGLFKVKGGTPTIEASVMPKSLFEHLDAVETPSVLVGGLHARQLPFTSGDQAAFLRRDGRIICRHGRFRSSLLRMKQAGKPSRCGCMPKAIPHRVLAMGGKWVSRRAVPSAKRILEANTTDNGIAECRSCLPEEELEEAGRS